MKILEITTFLKSGSGLFTTYLSKGLNSRGHSVTVISAGNVEEYFDWKELENELSFHNISHYKMNFFKREPEILWPEIRKLTKLLQVEKFDVIHVQAGVPAFAASIAKNMANLDIPLVATFHSWSPTRPIWMNVSDTWAFNQCDTVCFVSNQYKEFGINQGINVPTKMIYPGLWFNPKFYLENKPTLREKIRRKYNIPKDGKLVCHLAEVSERKGQIDLVRALGKLKGIKDNVYLIFCGNTTDYIEYTQKVKNEVEFYNLQDRVIFSEWVEDPYEIVSASDLFVFPSYNEGLGVAILEAIVLEIPTLFSNIEGTNDIREILGENCLGVFKPGNVDDISKLINTLLKNTSMEKIKRKVEWASKHILENFNFENTVEEYELIFNSLLKKQLTYIG